MKTKFSTICILGKPNAGKSTLVNRFVGQQISIATHKAQTTRNRILGIYTKDNSQLVFIDTPGIFNAKTTLEKSMVRTAWSSISGSNIIVLLYDVSSKRPVEKEFLKIIDYLKKFDAKILLMFNKIDKVTEKPKSLNTYKDLREIINDKAAENIDKIVESLPDSQIFFTSITKNINIDKLLDKIIDISPYSDFMYESDQITDAPIRFLAEEITREKLFLNLQEELPYNLAVETDKFEYLDENEVKIHQTILVKRKSHKAIILGKAGENIKKIGILARKSISEELQLKVHLFLFIKIREEWDTKSSYYQKFGMLNPFNKS